MEGGPPASVPHPPHTPDLGLDKWPAEHPAPWSSLSDPTYISLQAKLSPAQLNLSAPLHSQTCWLWNKSHAPK